MTFRRWILVLAALGALGCNRSPVSPDAPNLEFAEIVLLDQSTENLIYSHDDHWHGVLRARPGEVRPFRIYFLKQPKAPTDHSPPEPSTWFSIENEPEYRVRVTMEDDVATWTGDRHQATLRGERVGATHVTFVVLRGATTVYQAPPVGLSVVE